MKMWQLLQGGAYDLWSMEVCSLRLELAIHWVSSKPQLPRCIISVGNEVLELLALKLKS